MKVKFAHIADIHLGAWRNDNLNQIGYQAFEISVDKVIEEKVNFVILSGDLYNISNPSVEIIDLATKLLKKLKDNDIPVYGILGSHDFSPSNRSMIRPLITAGLFNSVSKAKWTDDKKLQLKFTTDPKTKLKITGLRARKRALEIREYKILDLKKIEEEKGVKLYIFHTMIYELKPKEYESLAAAPRSFFPNGFHYYAGGHLHKTLPEILRTQKVPLKLNEKNNIIYPGLLSPTNFYEFENIQFGGFCIISGDINPQRSEASLVVEYIPIKIKEVISMNFNCEKKSAEQVTKTIESKIKSSFRNKIVLLTIQGQLASGRAQDIDTSKIVHKIKSQGAYEVLLKKLVVSSVEADLVSLGEIESNQEIEQNLINSSAKDVQIKGLSTDLMEKKIQELIEVLGTRREESVKVKDYKKNIEEKSLQIFDLNEVGG